MSLCQQRGQKKTHGERTWWYTQRNGASLFRFHPQPLALLLLASKPFCPIRFLLLLFNSPGWCWYWWWLILLGGEDRKKAETIRTTQLFEFFGRELPNVFPPVRILNKMKHHHHPTNVIVWIVFFFYFFIQPEYDCQMRNAIHDNFLWPTV